jgi:DNA-binding GntR family transcriptional regulator
VQSTVRARLSERPLARRGTPDLLASEIRSRILAGELMPGDPLREADLADAFRVARNTVREALRLLTREGLAEHAVHRGVTVRRHAPGEVREVFEVRTLIEAAVCRRVGSLDPEEVARLQTALEDFERAASVEDARAGLTANLEFHREMVRLLRNPKLDQIFDQLLGEIRLILTWLGSDVAGPWLGRNRRLLKLLQSGDEESFDRALRKYMADSDAEVVVRLEATPSSPKTHG